MGTFAKPLSLVLGAVLLLVGILGFFQNPILGLFAVDPLHNVVHLLSGVAGLVAWKMGGKGPKMFLLVFGAIYLLVTILGFVMISPVLGLLTINDYDNYLHAAIALVSLAVGASAKAPAMPGMGGSHPAL